MDPQASRPSLVQRLTAGARAGGRAWHSEFREEVGKLLRRPANENHRPHFRRKTALPVAAALLLGIAAAGWIGAHLLMREQSPLAAPDPNADVRRADALEERRAALGRPETARLFARPTISDIGERLALALPRGAALSSMAVNDEGALAVEVELPDPEKLRAAFAGDPILRRLRQVSQMNEGGPRVRLFAPAFPAVAGPPAWRGVQVPDPRAAAALASRQLRRTAARTGTLIEATEPLEPPPGSPIMLFRMAASGQEKALLSFVEEIENGTPMMRFASWRIEASNAADGAMRLEARVAAVWEPASSPRKAQTSSSQLAVATARPLDAALNRPLFVQAPIAPEPSAEEDFDSASPTPPELAGIVGRLPDAAVALVRAPGGGSRTLALGDSMEGWRLAALAPDAAFFTRGSEKVRVALPLQ